MISPLLWLLLAALGLTAPPSHLSEWTGTSPVFLTAPSNPRDDRPLAISVAHLPRRARNVAVVVDGKPMPAQPFAHGLYRTIVARPEAGVISLAVRFTLNGHRYQSVGPGVLVAAHGG